MKFFQKTLLTLSSIFISSVTSQTTSVSQKKNQIGTNWAVLVAGSNTYSNYRHQADICHAYQILSNNGIPDEQIIVFMYDDIANNIKNPRKGELINHPQGQDVYKNVPKDYTGENCNTENFLSVLKGNDMTGIGSGKTLKSTKNDKVFIYYADHGAVGLVAMPTGPYLYATDLIKTIQKMHDDGMYKEMVFYMEACESGSMFEKLPTDLNVYVTTASNPSESSYACYYDSSLQTYLGDCYSVNWMENTENVSSSETLEEQYESVKKLTTQSHVMQYGQLSIDKENISEFLQNNGSFVSTNFVPVKKRQMLNSRDVYLKYLVSEIYFSKNEMEFYTTMNNLFLELKFRENINILFQRIDKNLKQWYNKKTLKSENFDLCFKKSIENVEQIFGKFTEYSLKYVKVFYDACQNNVPFLRIQDELM